MPAAAPQAAPVGRASVTPAAPSANQPKDDDAMPAHLSQADAVADVRELGRLLESTHPDCYSPFGGRVAFGVELARVVRDVPADGLTPTELSRRLQGFLSKLSDGHSFVDGTRATFDFDSARLPARFSVTTDGLHLSAAALPELANARGQRLVAYGGVSIPDLIGRLRQRTAVENEFQAYAKLRWWLTYASGCSQLLGRDCSRGVELRLQGGSGTTSTTVHTLAFESGGEPATWPLPLVRGTTVPPSDAPFRFVMLERPSAAYFRVATLFGREAFEFARRYGWADASRLTQMLRDDYGRRGQAMPSDLDAAIAGVPSFYDEAHRTLGAMKTGAVGTLIVDLRGNDGGATPTLVPVFYELFGDAYFAHVFRDRYVTRYSPLFLQQMHKTIEEIRDEKHDPSLQIGDYVLEQPEAGTPAERRDRQLAEYDEKGFEFAARLRELGGRPYVRPSRILVLSDAETFSAAFHMLAYLKEMGAEIVGVPPGQSPNAFMDMTRFELTHSHLGGSISNSVQMFRPDAPAASVFPVDHALDWEAAARFGFDDDATLRLALALVGDGAAPPAGAPRMRPLP